MTIQFCIILFSSVLNLENPKSTRQKTEFTRLGFGLNSSVYKFAYYFVKKPSPFTVLGNIYLLLFLFSLSFFFIYDCFPSLVNAFNWYFSLPWENRVMNSSHVGSCNGLAGPNVILVGTTNQVVYTHFDDCSKFRYNSTGLLLFCYTHFLISLNILWSPLNKDFRYSRYFCWNICNQITLWIGKYCHLNYTILILHIEHHWSLFKCLHRSY